MLPYKKICFFNSIVHFFFLFLYHSLTLSFLTFSLIQYNMLASCPQDLFFNSNNDHKDKRSRHFHHQPLRKDSMMSTSSDLMVGLNVNDMSNNINNNNNKDKEEQVWPPDVESAFIEGTLHT